MLSRETFCRGCLGSRYFIRPCNAADYKRRAKT
jgi:hypothetical protein